MKNNRTLFLTLKVFSATGGIEKVCRVAGKALYDSYLAGMGAPQLMCMHDAQSDAEGNKYFPAEIFRGYNGDRIRFIYGAVAASKSYDIVVLSHINLILVGWLIKKLRPSVRLILLAHGIEVWNLSTKRKRRMLRSVDEIISVSHFTSDKIKELDVVAGEKCRVLNNCLDPFLPLGGNQELKARIQKKYGFADEDQVLFTLTRLSSKERYKGYDKVIESMASLKVAYPRMKYLLAGSYDVVEKNHLEQLIAKFNLTDRVTLAGFIPEEQLVEHFLLADIYVMPSMKEGFGIVFIEAMYYRLPVIAGNRDGSVDALCEGKLGLLVDPLNSDDLSSAIQKILNDRDAFVPNRELLMSNFGYERYKENLQELLFHQETGEERRNLGIRASQAVLNEN